MINLENYGICRVVKFKSIVTLEEMATISLEAEDGVITRVPLRVYDHVTTVIHGDNAEFLLTPESSLKWAYNGGSYLWKNSHTNIEVNGRSIDSSSPPIITCPSR